MDDSTPDQYDQPTRAPRISSPRAARAIAQVLVAVWFVASAGAATAVIDVDVPAWVARPSAAALMVVFAIMLVHRAGGHMRLWVLPVAILAILALVTERNALLASAAVVTAVGGAVASVMMTQPAESLAAVLREYALTIAIAGSGMVGVAAWNAIVNFQRFNLVVLSLSLGIAMTLVWSLGAGLHGVSPQQLWLIVLIAAALVVALSYASFVRSHGSEMLTSSLDSLVVWARETFKGIPRPVEVFVGFPALILGVSMRARSRDGWWVLVFAVLGTAVLTSSLVAPGAFPSYIGLSTLYSVILGLAFGLLLRARFAAQRSARAARQFEADRRVEPGRFSPLR